MNTLNRIDASFVEQRVAELIGIPLELTKATSSNRADWEVRVQAFSNPYGFHLSVTEDFMAWWVELHLDSLGRATLDAMFRRWRLDKESFEAYINIGRDKNETFELLIDGMEPELLDSEDEWITITFEASKSYPVARDKETVLVDLLVDILSVLLALLIDNSEWAESDRSTPAPGDELGKEEGRAMEVRVRRYERSRFNRRFCLEALGFTCRGCGLSLGELYGPMGDDVIHVHHIVPVSKMGGAYRLNPRKDLVPLCPNCHNIVHRQDPPLLISQLNALTNYRPTNLSES